MTDVIIENVEPGQGKVVATFTAVLGGVTIHDCRLIDGSRGRFVAMPSKRRANSDDWYALVELSDALRSRVHHAIEDAVRDAAAATPASAR